MDNKQLLQRIELSHQMTARCVLLLRDLVENEHKFTTQTVQDIRDEILRNIQLNITEMQVLQLELGGDV